MTSALQHTLSSLELHSLSHSALVGAIWQRKVKKHEKYVSERTAYTSSMKKNLLQIDEKKAYDAFEPEWVCENEERLGEASYSIGDGPKFVCAAETLANYDRCIVYSIGSDWDFSFEKAIHQRAPNCEIHTFDGTMDLSERPLPVGLEPSKIHFHNWNIVAKADAPCKDISCKTYETTKIALGHMDAGLTMLKIDCEFCEYSVLPEILAIDGRVAQILIEMHGADPSRIVNLFSTLQALGLMIFHKERNHWGCSGWRCVEFSLISRTFALEALSSYLTPAV